jgi:hypothetical protein
MKKIITLLVLLQISFCFAQNNRSIENTTWRGIDNGRETEVTFLPNGIATYSYHNGTSNMTYNNAKWSQNGNRIYWEINNKFVEKNGEVLGDSFTGSARNTNGLEWTFTYKLVPANSAPFNPSKELALEQNRLMMERRAANSSGVSAQPSQQAVPKVEQNAQYIQQQTKLRELLKNTWGWDDATIQNSIIMETQNIKKQNPKFNEEQVRDAVYALWVKRAKDITNPEIIRVNVPNAVQLANVDPRNPDFVYPVENISYCNQHCLSVADYKKTCSVVKNLTYQAARQGGGSGMPQRLLEREGAISEVSFKMEKDIFGKDQCVMKYVLTGVFDGKKTGCRLYSLVTAFAVGQPGGIVANNAYPLQTHAGSTCALY